MLRVGGIVLCGGQSKRMGTAKAWLPIAGELMLPRVVRLVGEVVSPVVVVAGQDQEVPPLPGDVVVVRDEEPERGPLQGLASGLSALEQQVDAVFLSCCDAPFLRPVLIARLIRFLGDAQICVPFVDGFHHPLAAVYRIEVLPIVRQLLKENRLAPRCLVDLATTRIVEATELSDVDPTLESLRNVNTPAEYEQARRDAENKV